MGDERRQLHRAIRESRMDGIGSKNVSLFYCESFSQEWVSDMSGNLMRLKTQNEEIKKELCDLQKSVQSLLAERMR